MLTAFKVRSGDGGGAAKFWIFSFRLIENGEMNLSRVVDAVDEFEEMS